MEICLIDWWSCSLAWIEYLTAVEFIGPEGKNFSS
jgi:hypothetical protein